MPSIVHFVRRLTASTLALQAFLVQPKFGVVAVRCSCVAQVRLSSTVCVTPSVCLLRIGKFAERCNVVYLCLDQVRVLRMQRPTADIPHPVCCVGIQVLAIPTNCSTVNRRPAMLPDSRANASISPAGGRGRSARSALPKSLFKTQAVGTLIPQHNAAAHEPSSRYESYS